MSFSATAPRSGPAPEKEAIAQKPPLRAYINAEVRDQLVAGDVGRATVVHHRAAGDRCRAASGVRLSGGGISALLRLRGRLRESRAHAWRISSGLPAAAAVSAIVESTRTAMANAACARVSAGVGGRTPSLYPPPEVFDAANGRTRWPRLHSGCGIGSGRKLSRRRRAGLDGPINRRRL